MSDNNRSINVSGGNVYGAVSGGTIYGASNRGNVANQMTQGASIQVNNILSESEQKQTLAASAKEIQQLLEQLARINPNPTEAEKIEYVHDETTPSFKRRLIAALQASGEAAIEEFLDTRYVIVGKAIVKGWMKPE
ncbi:MULTISPECIES: hypothetical protein [unclassified Microcoleus]|uniref:hypothetical protein n=1 Tax=unclassified Microcoleus TaxID=2642155 RepID=UPI002FCFE57F